MPGTMLAGAGAVASGATATPPAFASPVAPMFQVPAAPTAGYYYPAAPTAANYYQVPAAAANPPAAATNLESYYSYLGEYDPAQPQAPVLGGAAIAATVGPIILDQLRSLLSSGQVNNTEAALTNAAQGIFQQVVDRFFHGGAGRFQLLPNSNDKKVIGRIVNFVRRTAGGAIAGPGATTAPPDTTTTTTPATGTSANTVTITITVTGANVQVKTDAQGGTTSTVAPAGGQGGTPPPPPPAGGQTQPNTPNSLGVSTAPAAAPPPPESPPHEPAPQAAPPPAPR
jgi:hypothetical protein